MSVNNIVEKLEGIADLVRFFNFEFDEEIETELTKNEIKTLIQIKFNSGQTLSYYSNKVGLKNGSFTSLSDKLEEKGLIKKRYLEGDKRKKIVVASTAGKEVTEKLYNSFVNYLSKKFSKLPDSDLVLMETAINILSKIDVN